METTQAAYARGQGYAFFAELILSGVTTELLPLVREIEELSEHLSTFTYGQLEFDPDEAAAIHQRMFGFNVFPFAGSFLTEEGQIGGEVTQQIQGLWKRLGLKWDWRGENPEHIGLQLRALSGLCIQESQSEPGTREALFFQRAQRDLLDQLILPWLPPLVLAIAQEEQPFYEAWAQMIWQWTLEHREALISYGILKEPNPEKMGVPLADIPEAEGLLSEKKTGLKDIGRLLLQPATSGWFLSRDTLGRVAGALELPRGFGGRFQMLESVLFTAIDHDKTSVLMESFLEEADLWQNGLQTLLIDKPEWATLFVNPWLERLENTRRILQTLQNAGSTLAE